MEYAFDNVVVRLNVVKEWSSGPRERGGEESVPELAGVLSLAAVSDAVQAFDVVEGGAENVDGHPLLNCFGEVCDSKVVMIKSGLGVSVEYEYLPFFLIDPTIELFELCERHKVDD